MKTMLAVLVVCLIGAFGGWLYLINMTESPRLAGEEHASTTIATAGSSARTSVGKVPVRKDASATSDMKEDTHRWHSEWSDEAGGDQAADGYGPATAISRREGGKAGRGGYGRETILVSSVRDDFAAIAEQTDFSVIDVMRLDSLGMTVYEIANKRPGRIAEAIRRVKTAIPGSVVDRNSIFRMQARRAGADRMPRQVAGWRKSKPGCGAGIRIGMIDTPVSPSRPGIEKAKIVYRSFIKKGREPASAQHGTEIAGMFVGAEDWGGLIPEADLYAANVFERTPFGEEVATAGSVMRALDWMAEMDVHVVNMSVAGSDNEVVRDAFTKVRRHPLVIVGSAGQGNEDGEIYPAAYANVIAVTASDDRGNPVGWANHGDFIDFAAPGVEIMTLLGSGSGTSLAAPFVSALSGLAIINDTDRNVGAVRARLQQDAKDMGSPGKDPIYGWGFIKQSIGMDDFCGSSVMLGAQ